MAFWRLNYSTSWWQWLADFKPSSPEGFIRSESVSNIWYCFFRSQDSCVSNHRLFPPVDSLWLNSLPGHSSLQFSMSVFFPIALNHLMCPLIGFNSYVTCHFKWHAGNLGAPFTWEPYVTINFVLYYNVSDDASWKSALFLSRKCVKKVKKKENKGKKKEKIKKRRGGRKREEGNKGRKEEGKEGREGKSLCFRLSWNIEQVLLLGQELGLELGGFV